jgi:hypothetical protein
MPIASDYPFLDVLWSMLIFMGLILWIWLAVAIFADIFRRHDMGGFAKAVWIICIIFIPLVGVLVYVIAYHNQIADRNASAATAQQLLDAGTITQSEFDVMKAKALAA